MIKLLAILLHAFLWDANAARRWLRGSVGILAVSGAAYAEQVAALTGSPKLAAWVRGLAFLCAFAVAAHDAQRKKKAAQVLELKP